MWVIAELTEPDRVSFFFSREADRLGVLLFLFLLQDTYIGGKGGMFCWADSQTDSSGPHQHARGWRLVPYACNFFVFFFFQGSSKDN